MRRLEAQIGSATHEEIGALQRGEISLSLQAVVARFFPPEERRIAVAALRGRAVRASRLETGLVAVGWPMLQALGPEARDERTRLLGWLVGRLVEARSGRDLVLDLARSLKESLNEEIGRAAV